MWLRGTEGYTGGKQSIQHLQHKFYWQIHADMNAEAAGEIKAAERRGKHFTYALIFDYQMTLQHFLADVWPKSIKIDVIICNKTSMYFCQKI